MSRSSGWVGSWSIIGIVRIRSRQVENTNSIGLPSRSPFSRLRSSLQPPIFLGIDTLVLSARRKVAPLTHQRLGDRRAADDGKAGRIGDAVIDPLALARRRVGLALDDLAGDFLGRKLQADVGLAQLHAVVLPIDDQRPARQHAAVVLESVLDDGGPQHRERPGAAPVETTGPGPPLRDRERLDDVPASATIR